MPDTLLIYEAGTPGTVVAVAACNEKSRSKSLEQGELWIVDPATARVLPFAEGGVRHERFEERDSWWEVRIVEPAVATIPQEPDTSGAEPSAERSAGYSSSSSPRSHSAAPAPPTETVLSALGNLIAERHRTMPEGSYTTHLFSKGAEKIRKKVGEEAVELILAATSEEIRSEGADLIYHMMVLLEAEGLRLEEVLAELDRRHRQG